MSTGIGEALRAAREQQGLSIDEAAYSTRVRSTYLRALEDEEFGAFGGDVYAKGFLSTYARYLKLDPSPLLEAYRSEVQEDRQETPGLVAAPVVRQPWSSPPTWIAWAFVTAVALAGAVALANVIGGIAPEPAAGPTEVATTGTSGTGATTPGATTDPSPSPSPSPTFEGVNLTVAFEERSWARIEVDGEIIEEETIEAGSTRELEAEEEVTIRLGNAGGVRATLNGEDVGSLGARGEVTTVTFTPTGVSRP